MNTEEYFAPFQRAVLAVLGVTDLTTTGFVDLTAEHDPISAAVLEEARNVA